MRKVLEVIKAIAALTVFALVAGMLSGGYQMVNQWIDKTAQRIDNPPTTATTIELTRDFRSKGISFSYSSDWIVAVKETDEMRGPLKSQGSEIIVVMLNKTKDEAFGMEIQRQNNRSSFDSFYEGKKGVAEEASSGNSEFEKYGVEIVRLQNIGKTVLGNAKKKNGMFAISYQFLCSGYEYDINFLYLRPNGEAIASSQKEKTLRNKVMDSVSMQQDCNTR